MAFRCSRTNYAFKLNFIIEFVARKKNKIHRLGYDENAALPCNKNAGIQQNTCKLCEVTTNKKVAKTIFADKC